MTFNDIHQRVAADISFDEFLSTLRDWDNTLCGGGVSLDDCPCPYELTVAESHFVARNI